MELEKLKNKAAEAFAKGKFGRAAELYGQYCRSDPRDLQARIRMGDAWARMGERTKAIDAYQTAAEGFARDGFFPRAIAASKLVLELDPTHNGVQQMLADLYAKRSGTGRDALVPASPSASTGPAPARVEPALSVGGKGAVELPPVENAELPLMRNAVGEVVQNKPPSQVTGTDDRVAGAKSTGGPGPAASPPVAGDEFDLEVDLSTPAEAFTELDLDGESLLHAVERAARIGAQARPPQLPVAPSEPPLSPAPENKLPEVPLFSDLPRDAFIELFERGPLLRFKKGERIFEQGSVGRSFFIICQGSVRVIREGSGSRQELAVLPEGSFFGEMALLSESPRVASVEAAAEEVEVLEITAALLSELSRRHPPVAAALKRFCRQRLLLNVMNTSALFQPFAGKDRRALIERFLAREVPSSMVVIREGAHSDGLYVVLSGEVQVSRNGHVLAHLREGDVFGEMSLLQKAPATATVTAVRRTSLLRLPREDFDELIMSHPQVLVLVSELTDDRRRQTDAILSGAVAVGANGLILV